MTVANAKITTNSLALAMGYFSRQARVWPRRAAGHRDQPTDVLARRRWRTSFAAWWSPAARGPTVPWLPGSKKTAGHFL